MQKDAMPRVLINCSNLHLGGGVAVATSFIDCLSKMEHSGFEISLLLSTSVERNLSELGADLSKFSGKITHNFFGISSLWSGLDKHFDGFDLVFTVFGPAYFVRRNAYHLFGFAQPNIIFPQVTQTLQRSIIDRLCARLKYDLQAWFFSRADAFVVELEHVKEGLMRRRLFHSKPISVVYSSVHTVYTQPDKWAPLNIPTRRGCLKLGVISRNYPHKNLAVLPEVKAVLKENHFQDTEIYVTLPETEWKKCSARFRNSVVNVGELGLSQCPTFYSAMDGVIFPTLLECFSAVPIEAMSIGRPLFASNRTFIKEVCGEHCRYFDPNNPDDIATVIINFFRLPMQKRQDVCQAAKVHASRFPGPEERAGSYLGLIAEKIEAISQSHSKQSK